MAPIAPAAGPESAVRIGQGAGAGDRHQAAARLVHPDGGVRRVDGEGLGERREVGRHHRQQVRVEARRQQPLVFPELGLDLDEIEMSRWGAARRSASARRRSWAGLRNENRKQTAQASAPLATTSLTTASMAASLGASRTVAGRGDALGQLEPTLARDEGRREVGLEVVELRPDLAPDLQQVPKAFVTTRASLPPRPWISALVATVVPWLRRDRAAISTPWRRPSSRQPSAMARAGLSGVDEVLWSTTRPVLSSRRRGR
jgi:hypothetical protein